MQACVLGSAGSTLKRDHGHQVDVLFLVRSDRQRKCQDGRDRDGGKYDEVKPILLRVVARGTLSRGLFRLSSALGVETRALWRENAVLPSYPPPLSFRL